MDIRLLEKNDKEKKMSFLLKGVNAAFANLLRRYIIEKVPTMAIEDVEFKENTSILYDEVIAHRLGLVPLATDLKSYMPVYKCKCKGEGCSRCTLKLTLKAQGPKTVYASEIKSRDSKVKPVYPKMPIVKLLKEQKVELLATAVLGRGFDHIKFSPGLAHYRFYPEVAVKKIPKNAEEVAKSCPLAVFDFKNNSLAVNKDNAVKCHLCGQCAETAEPAGSVEAGKGSDIIFNVEGWGQLSCREMVLTALDEYGGDLAEFENMLKLLKKA